MKLAMEESTERKPMGVLEQLDADIARLSRETGDREFLEYLHNLKGRLIGQKYQADLLRDELDHRLRLWEKQQRSDVEGSAYFEAPGLSAGGDSRGPGEFSGRGGQIFLGTPAVGEEGSRRENFPSEPEAAPRSVSPTGPETAPRSVSSTGPETAPRSVSPTEPETAPRSVSLTEPQAAPQVGMSTEPQAVPRGRFSAVSTGAQSEGAPVYQAVPVQMRGVQSGTVYTAAGGANFGKKEKKNKEFIVGATLLGIIGSCFILAALVMLGMNFMSSFVLGISMYGIFLAVLAASELFVFRRAPRLGITLSSLAVGGLYITNAVNFLSLQILNMWETFAVVMALGLAVFLLSRKRNSLMYRIMGLTATYLSFLMLQDGIAVAEFLAVSAMILFINFLVALLPVEKGRFACRVTHMILNAVFTIFYVWRAQWCGVADEIVLIYEVAALAVLHMLFTAQLLGRQRASEAREGAGRAHGGDLVAYCVSGVLHLVDIGLLLVSLRPDGLWFLQSGAGDSAGFDVGTAFASACVHASMLGILVICLVSFLAMQFRRCPGRWYVYYFFNAAVWVLYIGEDQRTVYVAALVLLILAKILSLRQIKEVRGCEAVVTAFVCLGIMLDPEPEILLLGIPVSILCLSQWKTYHEFFLTVAVVVYAAGKMPPSLQLPLAVGILFVGILTFNNVKRWRDSGILAYNALALSGQAACFLLLLLPVYRNAFLTWLCMLVFGLATVVLTLRERYQMDFKRKNMVLAVFLTYMSLVLRVREPIVNSILLMVIALAFVGMGFKERQKSTRVYGLTLSLLVCVKMVLYDFLETPIMQRTILFFIVGVIALIIAAIYIILEKRTGALNVPQERSDGSRDEKTYMENNG